MSAAAQTSSPVSTAHGHTDVVLFIRPDSPNTARVGLSYRKLIPHAQVVREIRKLMAVSGWKLSGEPSISDGTVRPDEAKRFPPTTSAIFSVADAPQFRDNAPVLSPYLKAFQGWDHLEILFEAADLVPYNGVVDFHDPALDVNLAKSEGVYDYTVTLREHTKDLPPLVPVQSASVPSPERNKITTSPSDRNSHSSAGAPFAGTSVFLPYLCIFVGCVLIGGAAFYLLLKRHQENLKPGRSR